MSSRKYTVSPVKPESPREVERQRDEYRAALIGIVVMVVVGGGLYWLMGVLR